MSFNQNKFQVIKKAVPYELANFVFNYFLLKRDAVNYMYKNNIIAENSLFGTWKDQQVPNVYSHYADFVMETLLMKVMPIMKQQTNLNLIPTYSYARIYEKGSILKRQCEAMKKRIFTKQHRNKILLARHLYFLKKWTNDFRNKQISSN